MIATHRLVARGFMALLLFRDSVEAWEVLFILGGLVADGITVVIVSRSDRLSLVPRLALDATDAAVWAISVPVALSEGNFVIASLAIETAFRLGFRRALVVPAVCGGAIAILATAFDASIQPAAVAWAFFGVTGGALLRLYDRADVRRHLAVLSEVEQAVTRRGYRSGQNSVAMGADSVVDLIHATVAALGRPRPGTALYSLLDEWKANLRRGMQGHASYLGDVLASWRQVNNLRPDLAGHCEFNLPEGAGTILLTAGQAAHLLRLLSEATPHGTVDIRILTSNAIDRPVGSRVELDVAGRVFRLPPESISLRPLDPAPITLALGAVYALFLIRPWAEAVPVALVLPVALASLAAAVWAQRALNETGPAARPRIMLVACAIAILLTGITTPAVGFVVGDPTAGHLQAFPITSALYPISIFIGLYGRSMGRLGIWAVGVTASSCMALTLWLYPEPVVGTHLAVAIGLQATALIPSWWFGRAFADAAEFRGESVSRQIDRARHSSFARGRDSVVDLLDRAGQDAKDLLHATRASIETPIVRHVEQRLEEVDQCLRQLKTSSVS